MRMTRQVVFLSNVPYMLEGGVGLQRELVCHTDQIAMQTESQYI
jgi:hypothetical protein